MVDRAGDVGHVDRIFPEFVVVGSSRWQRRTSVVKRKGAQRSPGAIGAVSSLTVGTVATQGVMFLTFVAIGRFYTPAEVASYMNVLAVASVSAAIATLRWEDAVPLAETDEEARDIVVLAMGTATVAVSVTVATTALVFSVKQEGGMPVAFLLLAACTSVALAYWSASRMLMARVGRFGTISMSGVLSTGLQGVVQAGGGALGAGPIWLSLGYLGGRLINALWLLAHSGGLRLRRFRVYVALGRRWKNMPIYLCMPVALNLLGIQALTPYLTYLFGAADAGSVSFALRILAVPAALIGQAIATVLLPHLARKNRAGDDLAIGNAFTATLLLLGAVPVFGLVFLLGQDLFILVFGEVWSDAGRSASILAPWFAFQFVSSPMSTMILVKNRMARLWVLALIELGARLGALAIGHLVNSLWVGVTVYAFVGCLIAISYILWTLSLSGVRLGRWVGDHALYVAVALAAYGMWFALRTRTPVEVYVLGSGLLTLAFGVWFVRAVMRREV